MNNIKELFPEFYQKPLDKDDLKQKSENIIILDTNYLLEVLKSPVKISETYVKALEKVKNNIYIPYLVALEFNFNKSKIKKSKIKNTRDYTTKIKNKINDLEDSIQQIKFLNEDAKTSFTENLINLTKQYSIELNEQIEKNIQAILTDEQDALYNRLVDIITDKVGDAYTQEKIDQIQKEGEKRYNNNIPPGFDDKKKDDSENTIREYNNIHYSRKYGDLIIWKDILEFAKQYDKKGNKVIFITNDGTSKNKNDFLYKIDNLTVGPHVFLMNELQNEASKELHVLNNLRFIQLVSDLTDIELDTLQETLDNQENLNKSSGDTKYRMRLSPTKYEEESINLIREKRNYRRRLMRRKNNYDKLMELKDLIREINVKLEKQKKQIYDMEHELESNIGLKPEHDAYLVSLLSIFKNSQKELELDLIDKTNLYFKLSELYNDSNDIDY